MCANGMQLLALVAMGVRHAYASAKACHPSACEVNRRDIVLPFRTQWPYAILAE